jgi:hypothetical protein
VHIEYQNDLKPGQAEILVRDLLEVSFGPEELGNPSELITELVGSGLQVCSAWDCSRPLGAAIGWLATPEITMLSWLAVSPLTRGHGVGSELFHRAISQWESCHNPLLILGEVENPHLHVASEQHGDPRRRWAFYQRLGAKYLDFPFEMPRLSPNVPVGEDMWLVSFAGRAHGAIDPQTGELSGLGVGNALREFLDAYLRDSAETRDENGKYRLPVERMLEAAAQLD